MKVIYEPKGKAGEYGELAVNLYNGCSHGCVYCYAPNVVHKNRDEFFNNPQPRKDILKLLARDLDEMVKIGDRREVFMCFTCDPFQPCEEDYGISLHAMIMLEDRNIPYKILTKGKWIPGLLANDRVDLCKIGSTLVFANDIDSKKNEPGAPVTSERIDLLKRANEYGYSTWVSLEPVWTPRDAFALIERTHVFVDEYKIGKLNYHPQSKNVDWKQFAIDVSQLCDELGCKYTLKEDLRNLLGVGV